MEKYTKAMQKAVAVMIIGLCGASMGPGAVSSAAGAGAAVVTGAAGRAAAVGDAAVRAAGNTVQAGLRVGAEALNGISDVVGAATGA